MLLERINHKGEKRIAIKLPYEEKYMTKVRSIEGRKWSASLKLWHVPDTKATIDTLKKLFPEFLNTEKPNREVVDTKDSDNNSIDHILRPKSENAVIFIRHNKKDSLLYISCPYKHKEIIKKATHVRWDSKNRLFVVASTQENIYNLIEDIKKEGIPYKFQESDFTIIKKKSIHAYEKLPQLNEESKKELGKLEHWMTQKRYAKSTISDYKSCLSVFFRYFAEKDIYTLGVKDIESFNYNFIIANHYSEKTQNQYISAIKTFYIKMYNINHEIEHIERPISGRKLPRIIAKDDVKKILRGTKNLKHRVVLSLIYSLGLRKSELINLKIRDVNFTRNTVDIINSKGKRDRVLPLPASIVPMLMQYLDYYDPSVYFVEGRKKGSQYSETSVSNIFKKNVERVIKNHNFTPHSFRHSYATHLLDSGVDLRYIQELLGHKSSKTTEIYTHVSMKSLRHIKNPIDDFEL